MLNVGNMATAVVLYWTFKLHYFPRFGIVSFWFQRRCLFWNIYDLFLLTFVTPINEIAKRHSERKRKEYKTKQKTKKYL